jgi:hypothetical protein
MENINRSLHKIVKISDRHRALLSRYAVYGPPGIMPEPDFKVFMICKIY